MSEKLLLTDLDLRGKKILMRVDFNVPLDDHGNIVNDSRIAASLPSIKYVLDKGGSLILMSHLGRPKAAPDPKYSLAPCARRLSKMLGKNIMLAPDCIGEKVEDIVRHLKPGDVLLLENLRFHKGEEKPIEDPAFAKLLANLGDVYVNDAFATAHRAHASTAEIARYFPGKAAAGFLMEKEIQFLGNTLINPKRPFYAIIGGAKISTKLGVLKALLKKADGILIGGGMAYTFYKAQGIAIGDSIHEDNLLDKARDILQVAKSLNKQFQLPIDNMIADRLYNDPDVRIVDSKQGIPDGFQGVDIGPKTIKTFVSTIQNAATIFWNGPMGVFEISSFALGTTAISHAVANSKAITIVGGGESIAAVEAAGDSAKITHLSTGGGATLEYIEFGKLPGIEALTTK